MREVAWVVFDEIHYMRDAGVYCLFVVLTFSSKNFLVCRCSRLAI